MAPSAHCSSPIFLERAAWWGARMAYFIPSSAMISSVSKSTAVSASHIASGKRWKRDSKSLMPQMIWVRLSREFASGMMMWL